MLMLDHHINDGALTPRQGHEQCEGGGGPSLFPTERYLFIYLFNKDWGIFLIKSITTKIPCTRHGVSLVVRVVSQLFKFSEKGYNYKDTLHKARGIFSSLHSFLII